MPTCVKCGAPNPTVHVNGLRNDLPDTRHYCAACADLEDFPAEIKQAARAFDQRHRKAKFDAQVQQFDKTLGPQLEELCGHDPRFPREAYDFVFKSVLYAVNTVQPKGCPRHVTASELIEGCKHYAQETWGTSAKAHLAVWGIKTSSDVGEIVFLLVENGFMGKKTEDNRSDFDHLPFLESWRLSEK